MMKYQAKTVTAAFLLCLLFSVYAYAGQISVGFENMPQAAGIGLGFIPDYDGSDDYMVGAAPFARITRPGHEQYMMLTVTELQVNILDHPWLRLGPSLNYRFGRSDVRDHYVDRMRDIDGTLEGGGWFGVEIVADDSLRKRFIANIDILADMTNEHDGYTIYGNIRGWYPLSETFDAGFGFTMCFASNNFMDTYFGVDEKDSDRSGLPYFNAQSGVKDVRFNPALVMHITPKWHAAIGLQYRRLLEDASDSPIVDERGDADQFIGGIGVAYSW